MKDLLKIIKYSWSLKRYYIATMTFAVTVALLSQVTPFLFKFIVDALVNHLNGSDVSFGYFALMISLVLLVNIAIAVISNYSGYLGDLLGIKLSSLLTKRYYSHLLKLPLQYFDNQQAGKVTSRLDRSITTVSEMMQAFANNFIEFFLTSIITIAVMAYFAWPLAVLLAILFPFYIWLTSLSSKSWQKKQIPRNKYMDITKGRFVESIGQIRVVKSYVQEDREYKFMSRNFQKLLGHTKSQSVEWHWYDLARRSGLSLIFASIYAVIIWQTWVGNYTLGTFTLLLQLAMQAQMPLFAASWMIDSIQRAIAGSKDYFEAMETEPSIKDAKNAMELIVKNHDIEFNAVDFAYENGAQVLNGVSFKIKENSRVAIVGESGEGKTTIANLILRFYEPHRGAIAVGGVDIASVKQTSLREQIGVVFQDPSLFSGTVRENISYAKMDATEAEIMSAAKAANALDFINKLPKGIDTEIGERGVKLSGGQKQRIAIARAILKNAPILILDEATSSLDSRAEHEVQQALDKLMNSRTTLIIAHRLSTIASVDMIIGLKGGKVVEQGSPAELAGTGGIYSELLALQKPTDANIEKLKTYDINS